MTRTGGPSSLRQGIGALAVLSALVLGALWLVPAPSQGRAIVTFTVNSTDDTSDLSLADAVCDVSAAAGNQCTLRAAIEQANDDTGANEIDFDLGASGPFVIAPATALPPFSHPLTINGYSQAGATPNTLPLGKGSNAVLRIQISGRNLPASSNTLEIGTGAAGSVIEGLDISGATGTGILVRASAAIIGNFIGTDLTGMKRRGGAFDGIFGFGGAQIQIGGSDRAERNLIADNGDSAVTSNSPVQAQGNLIGLASDGKKLLGNHAVNHIGALTLAGPSNVVGGLGDAANAIAGNDRAGIALLNDAPPSTFSRNRIYANGGPSIDLEEDGPTANDHLDPDVGPNKLQNFPKLLSAKTGRTKTVIAGKLDSIPAPGYVLEFFVAPKGTSGAVHFLGTKTVRTRSSGIARFKFKSGKLRPGLRVSATATAATGATSELSGRVAVKKR